MRPSNNLENETLSDTYWRVQLVCLKVQAHSLEPLEIPLEHNQDRTPLTNKVCYDFFNHLGSYENIMQFQTSSRKENR